MSWRSIYISESEKLSLYLDSLSIRKDETDYKIPLKDIGTIVVENNKTIFTLKILNKFIEYGITLITCDDEHNPCGMLVPTNSHSRQYKIVIKQISWLEAEKNEIWKEIIIQKLINQREVLIKLNKSIDVIKKMTLYIESVETGDITNREGIGAGLYFRELYGKGFKRRVTEDIMNSALNYGCTILTSKISRIIAGRGLLTYVGIHHKNEYNQFNLSCDLVEIFRPIVDYYICENLLEAEYFSKEHRIELVNLLNSKINYLEKKEFVSNVMEKFVDIVINFFETGESLKGRVPNLETLELYEL